MTDDSDIITVAQRLQEAAADAADAGQELNNAIAHLVKSATLFLTKDDIALSRPTTRGREDAPRLMSLVRFALQTMRRDLVNLTQQLHEQAATDRALAVFFANAADILGKDKEVTNDSNSG